MARVSRRGVEQERIQSGLAFDREQREQTAPRLQSKGTEKINVRVSISGRIEHAIFRLVRCLRGVIA